MLLLAGLGGRPVQRAQEARVLETARQMLGQPLDRWMVPRVNERLRLRKPPLAYWATAGAYRVGHVSEGVGRVPTALASWLTLAGTYAAGSWLFGRRAGVLAAAALLSSYLFFWHARLAETDAWATLFVTFASFGFWRAVAPDPRAESFGAESAAPTWPSAWFHFGAACVGLATLSKGAPALFPMLFLVALALTRRRPRALWHFVRCGAPVTAVLPGGLWLYYASRHADLGQVAEEFSNNWRGYGHGAPFYAYFYLLPLAAAPWTGLMVLAAVEAARRWRQDPRLQGLLLWSGSVLLPLFVTGNKQPHYLMTLMPCAMILVGWAMDEMLRHVVRDRFADRDPELPKLPVGPAPEAPPSLDYALAGLGADRAPHFAGVVSWVFWVTVGIGAAAAVAAPFAAHAVRGAVRPPDFAVAAGVGLAMGAVAWTGRRLGMGPAVWGFGLAWAVALVVFNAWWWPSVDPNNPRAVAAQFRRVAGDGPYCSYGTVAYLPLCFALRTEVPSAFTAGELRQQVAAEPGVHVIVRRRPRDARALPDIGFVRVLEVPNGEYLFELYRRGTPAGPVPAVPPARHPQWTRLAALTL